MCALRRGLPEWSDPLQKYALEASAIGTTAVVKYISIGPETLTAELWVQDLLKKLYIHRYPHLHGRGLILPLASFKELSRQFAS